MISSLRQMINEDCQQVSKGRSAQLSILRNGYLLVTGGTGFVGTWVAELVAFLNDKYNYNIHLSLLASQAHTFSGKAPHLASRSDITLIERDVRGIFELPKEVEWIIHAAGNPDNRMHASDPISTISVITQGTNAMLSAAENLPKLRCFVNVSSGLVYGKQPWNLSQLPETYPGTLESHAVKSAYSEAKRIAETLCGAYRSQRRLPIVNVRPFAFVGPYQLLDRPWAINNFIHDSLLGGPIRILGDGETVRSYMYPSDMAWWLLRILAEGDVGANYNIGSPVGITLRQAAEIVANYSSSHPQVQVSQVHDNARSCFVPDVSMANNKLDLSITVDIEEAIKKTVNWNSLLFSR